MDIILMVDIILITILFMDTVMVTDMVTDIGIHFMAMVIGIRSGGHTHGVLTGFMVILTTTIC